MVQGIIRLLFISLLSCSVFAGDNVITLQTKGSGSTITIKQAGNSNTTGIYCGLGSFDNSLVNTHTYSGGDDNDVNLTQQGNGAHTSNMKFYTDSYDVTVIQKGSSNQSYSAQFNCSGSGCNKTISITQQ
jgi:hypothetical protein